MQFVLLLLSVLLPSSALLHSLLLAYFALLHQVINSNEFKFEFNEDGMPLLVAALLGTHSSLLVEVCISVLSTSV